MLAEHSLDFLLTGIVDVGESYAKTLVQGLSTDSRRLRKGDVFFACRGEAFHGLQFAEEAVEKGASCVLWEPPAGLYDMPVGVPVLAVPGLRTQIGVIADRFYDRPSRDIPVVAVTGTDGKTSVSHFLAELLEHLGRHCGLIGTLGSGFVEALESTGMTTPDAVFLHRRIRELRDSGAVFIVIEASSHGLAQHRLAGLAINVAVLTNLGHDHLDYHGSRAAYVDAKRSLFESAGLETAVVNADDAFGRELAERCQSHCQVLRYSAMGAGNAEVWAEKIVADGRGLRFTIRHGEQSAPLHSVLLGKFNVLNLLAVLSVLLATGEAQLDELAALAKKIQPATGRMQRFSVVGTPVVVLDYAHTPQALNEALSSCREMTTEKLHCVFGCGGERDRTKRPLMGAIASRLADSVVLTDDNPRRENPERILQEILAGAEKTRQFEIIHDRRTAIRQVLSSASVRDCVLVAGKGHEAFQENASGKQFFSDAAVISEWLYARREKLGCTA